MDHDQAHRESNDEIESQSDKPIFSLTCRECDAGQGIASVEEAIAEGWTEIALAVELVEANFCGLCPQCKREEDDC